VNFYPGIYRSWYQSEMPVFRKFQFPTNHYLWRFWIPWKNVFLWKLNVQLRLKVFSPSWKEFVFDRKNFFDTRKRKYVIFDNVLFKQMISDFCIIYSRQNMLLRKNLKFLQILKGKKIEWKTSNRKMFEMYSFQLFLDTVKEATCTVV